MTIYDVLRHLVSSVSWGGPDDIEEHRRKAVAIGLVDELEGMGLLGTVANTVTRELVE